MFKIFVTRIWEYQGHLIEICYLMPESKETQKLFWTFEELEDCNYSRHNFKLDEPKEVL